MRERELKRLGLGGLLWRQPSLPMRERELKLANSDAEARRLLGRSPCGSVN